MSIDQTTVQLQRFMDRHTLGDFTSLSDCERAKNAASGGVVCAWFVPGMPIGKDSWEETGWRPRNIETGVGLGRKTISSFEECLEVSKHARGSIVCTNTGLGYKPTNIETNLWCGASSQLDYCKLASLGSTGTQTCSFPSSGTGAESGWVKTEITSSCNYVGGKTTVQECIGPTH